MAGMSEKKILEAREHLREAEKWYNICIISCYRICAVGVMCRMHDAKLAVKVAVQAPRNGKPGSSPLP